MRSGMILSGLGLLGLAVTPTPDDVTIVSPLLQGAVGVALIIAGVIAKGEK